MRYFKLGVTFFAFLAITAFVWASESDELREQAKAMEREAAELAERGHGEEAANLKRRVMEMLKEAERLERHHPGRRETEIRELERRLEKLRMEEKELAGADGNRERREDVRREAHQVAMEIRELSHDRHPEHPAPHQEIARRLEHMHIAVEHLNHAGLHDIAEHVAERAHAAERELHQHRRHHEGDVMQEMMRQLDELRHEVGRLREEVNELRERR